MRKVFLLGASSLTELVKFYINLNTLTSEKKDAKSREIFF